MTSVHRVSSLDGKPLTQDILLNLSAPSLTHLSQPLRFFDDQIHQAASKLTSDHGSLVVQISSVYFRPGGMSRKDPSNFLLIQRLLSTVYFRICNVLKERYGERSLAYILDVDVVLIGLHGCKSISGGFDTVIGEYEVPWRSVEVASLGYPAVALGGTFDYLHPGHKILLTMVAWITSEGPGGKLICGVTDDALLTKKANRNLIQSLDIRTARIREFLSLVAPGLGELDLPPLQDIYGPTASDADIEALVVSRETREGGMMVNQERKRKGLSQLEIYEIGVISSGEVEIGIDDTDEDIKLMKIGSSQIRSWLSAQCK